MESTQNKETISKITRQLIPFLFVLYIVAYLDRANVSFAKLEMGRLAWFGDKTHDVFGLGSGIFFIGYFLFEVPSNLLLERVGARWWIARIMVTWGIIASAMLFSNSAALFYTLRFLLGIAEAGFFPGIILYLTYWYTAKERARIVALFMTATAMANAIGNPLSGKILSLHLPWLQNWQWMFLLEGIPAVILGFVVLAYLPDGPKNARFLTEQERTWAEERISSENSTKVARGRHHLGAAFTPAVWPLCLIYFTIAMTTYGVVFWLPDLVKKSGVANAFDVGWLTAIPYAIAAICMVLNGIQSDRTKERRLHVAIPLAVTAIGLSLAAFQHTTTGIMLAMSIAIIGIFCPLGPFWSLPTSILAGAAAAAGIAFVNSVGNLGGFAGPFLVGWIQKAYPHDKAAGVRASMLMLACVAIVGCITVMLLPRDAGRTPTPDDGQPAV